MPTRKHTLRFHSLGDSYYDTDLGRAFVGDSTNFLRIIPSESVNLVVTSPPFALRRKKQYGNVSADEYIDWFLPFAREIHRILTKNGSFVLDIGGAWNEGQPTRSLYHFELLLVLCKNLQFNLAQEFYWYNPAKLPAPAEWVNVRRIRVKDAVNPIWWLSKSSHPKASNRRVLTPYKESMIKLLKNGYNSGVRPSEHIISKNWDTNNKGAIPPNMLNVSNLLSASNTKSFDSYLESCRKLNLRTHPARFVEAVPEFFIKFLTTRGDIVLDPFAGSNVVGNVAERLNRRWISIELSEDYLRGSFFRFENATPRDPELKIFLRENRIVRKSIFIGEE